MRENRSQPHNRKKILSPGPVVGLVLFCFLMMILSVFFVGMFSYPSVGKMRYDTSKKNSGMSGIDAVISPSSPEMTGGILIQGNGIRYARKFVAFLPAGVYGNRINRQLAHPLIKRIWNLRKPSPLCFIRSSLPSTGDSEAILA